MDGQKFSVQNFTTKARYSRKYFGTGKGVVAYTLLTNHAPLQTTLIGAHEHESYYVYDIWYHNTSDISPDVLTGDMHSINKANFGILHWFGVKFQPRFTDLQAQLKHLYCTNTPQDYAHCLIKPIGQIERQVILEEATNIDRIITTLSLKEMSQSALVKKLCTHQPAYRTRKALFEFDKLIRSIYTLRYLRDTQLQRHVHRSQNRIESYHQLRAAIAQVSGKKQLAGRTDLDIAISNECGRLVANAIIYYNSAILSALLDKHQASGNQKAIKVIQKISPVAWQHIHFLGHYNFANKRAIDLEALVAQLVLINSS